MNNKGFNLLEMMVVTLILTVMMTGIYMSLHTGQGTFYNTNSQIILEENIRLTLAKISDELRESGRDSSSTLQVSISDGTGVSSSDVITFSIPVICESAGSIIDSSGDVANWGAPLTWGCTSSSCMDADDNCATVDYKSVQYAINSDDQLVRRVLDNSASQVQEEIFAQNISDFQAAFSSDQNMVTITVTSDDVTSQNRTVSATRSLNVHLRNRG